MMVLQLLFVTAILLISAVQAERRMPSALYADRYFNFYSNQKYAQEKFTEEFAHLAARFINFIGIRGTAERTDIVLKRGASQFQDQQGSDATYTNAAHQIKARIDKDRTDSGFIEMKNRLGHTDILDVALNRRVGTALDNVQDNVLKMGLLQNINFKDGYTDDNVRKVKDIRKIFVEDIDAKLENIPDPDPANYDSAKDLLTLARDTYEEDEIIDVAMKAGIVNYFNELKIEKKNGENVETTDDDIPSGIPFPPPSSSSSLSSKALLGRRLAAARRSS